MMMSSPVGVPFSLPEHLIPQVGIILKYYWYKNILKVFQPEVKLILFLMIESPVYLIYLFRSYVFLISLDVRFQVIFFLIV